MNRAPHSFSRAKIQPPRLRIEQLPRPRLEARLKRVLEERKLVLLSAPAGYGKTVLLSRALDATPANRGLAWLSADGDDDLQRLALALVTALEPYDLPWRVSPEALSALAAENLRLAADMLLDVLAHAELEAGLIVIEDAHRLADGRVFEWLDRLIGQLPANWHIAVTSRLDPPLALARLRVQGELAEFRAEDLRFSREDAQALARLHGIAENADLDSLWQRTHGWPVALQLALRTGHSAVDIRTSDRHTFDYLASEVLQQLPEALRLFLLRCAVLPELTVERCAAVAAESQAKLRLDEIERRGLFVTALAGQERTLRLHDLFRDFLAEQLQLHHPEELPELLRRAAAGERDPVRRVGYLLRAGDPAGAQQALMAATPAMLLEGAGAQVMRLLDQFPESMRRQSPGLAFVRGLHAWPQFQWERMREAMQLATQGFEAAATDTAGRAAAQQARAIEAMALLNLGSLDQAGERMEALCAAPENIEIAAFCEILGYWYSGARGPLEAPAQHLSRMLELLRQGASPALWYRCLPHIVYLSHPGVNREMAQYVSGALAAAGDEHPYLKVNALAIQAWLLLFQGRIEQATALMREVQDEVRWLGPTNNLQMVMLSFLGTLHGLRGEREVVSEITHRVLENLFNRHAQESAWGVIYLFQCGRWCLMSGDWEGFERLAGRIEATPSVQEWPFPNLARTLSKALRDLRRGANEDCETALRPLLPSSDIYDMLAAAPTLRIALALAQARQGRLRDAWETVAPAITSVRSSGERLRLMIAGPELLRELTSIDWGDVAPEPDLALLIGIFDQLLELRQSAAEADKRGQPADPLSEREREVLALIAAGDSNKLIARALELSPHTVKRHVANILNKLNLATRGHAAAWWHARQKA
jgi:LuxR family maltose regulon positive regulatory protein